MAAGDVTDRRVFPVGTLRMATGKVEHSTGGAYSFDTGLSRVDRMSIHWNGSDDGPQYQGYFNSNTTSDNVAGMGGKVHMVGDAAWGTNAQDYFFEAEGL